MTQATTTKATGNRQQEKQTLPLRPLVTLITADKSGTSREFTRNTRMNQKEQYLVAKTNAMARALLVIDRHSCAAYLLGTMQRNRLIVVPGVAVLLLLFALGLEATTVVNPGTKTHSLDIDWDGHKGTIDVHEGVTYAEQETQYQNAISLGYSGQKSSKCHWIQFVWREMLVTKTGESPKAKSGTVDTTSGSYELTTDPASPNYIVDSYSPIDPSYDHGFSNIRDQRSITIFDRPDSSVLLEKEEQADPKTEKIEAKTHLEAFLACKGKICAKITWTSTHTWTKAEGEKGPVFTIDAPDRSGTLNQAEKDKLKEKYPHQRKLRGRE